MATPNYGFEKRQRELLQAFEALMPGFLEQSETIYRKMAEDRGEAQPGDELSVEGTPFEEEGFAHSIERMAALVDVAMSPQGQRALTELLRKDRTAGEWLLDAAKSIMNAIPGVRLVNFGHLGDGNLHYNVQAPEGKDGPAFLRDWEDKVNTLVFDQVARFEGSISAEHGVGELKAHKLPTYKDPTALAMMRAIKHALDPQNLLNPRKVLA